MSFVDNARSFGFHMTRPDAVDAGQGQWRATVSIDMPLGSGLNGASKKCQFPQLFASREDALHYAVEQCRLKASRHDEVPAPTGATLLATSK